MCHFLIHNMENDLKVSNTKQSKVANHSPWKLKSFLENSVRNFLCGKRGHYSFPKLCSGMIALASRQEWSAGSTLRLKSNPPWLSLSAFVYVRWRLKERAILRACASSTRPILFSHLKPMIHDSAFVEREMLNEGNVVVSC